MPVPLARAEAPSFAPSRPHFPAATRSLLALAPDGCRWPIGDIGEDGFGFCGAPRPSRASYCDRHRALACEAVR